MPVTSSSVLVGSARRLGLPAASALALLAVVAGACASPVERGERLFRERGCARCHAIGAGARQGPDLKGVAERYGQDELKQWIRDPISIYRARDRMPINPGFPPMPRIPLEDAELDAIVAFLEARS